MVLEDKINNNKEILNLVRFSTTDEIIKKYSPNSKFYVSQNRKENKIQKVLSDFSLIPTTTDYFDQLSKKFVSQTSILIKIKPLVAKCIKQEDINLNKKTIYDIKQNIDKKILKCSINSAEQLIK